MVLSKAKRHPKFVIGAVLLALVLGVAIAIALTGDVGGLNFTADTSHADSNEGSALSGALDEANSENRDEASSIGTGADTREESDNSSSNLSKDPRGEELDLHRRRRPRPASSTPSNWKQKQANDSSAPRRRDPRHVFREIANTRGLVQSSQGRPSRPRRLGPGANAQVDFGPGSPTVDRQGLYAEFYESETPISGVLAAGGGLPGIGSSALADGPRVTRIDSNIDFPTRESFGLRVSDSANLWQHWIAIWHGRLVLEEDRTLILGFGSDIAGFVKLGSETVLFNDQFSWYREVYTELELKAGSYDLEVLHIEGPSRNDTNGNAAARLLFKESWEDDVPRAVPAEWLYLSYFHAKQSPEIAYVDAETKLKRGEPAQLSVRLPASTNEREEGLLTIHVDGYPARFTPEYSPLHALQTTLSSQERIVTFYPPAGMDAGVVNVEWNDASSNSLTFDIDDTSGALIQVWDLTGFSQVLPIPNDREPDFVTVLEDPFPLNHEDFPQFAGKPIAVRVSGELATSITGEGFLKSSASAALLEIGRRGQKGTQVDLTLHIESMLTRFHEPREIRTWIEGSNPDASDEDLLQELRIYTENVPFFEGAKDLAIKRIGTRALLFFTIAANAAFGGDVTEWWEFSYDAVLDPSSPISDEIDLHSDRAHRSVGDVRPPRGLASPPLVRHRDVNVTPEVGVGDPIYVYVDANAVTEKGDAALGFRVDGAEANWRLATEADVPDEAALAITSKGIAYQLARVVVPDGAGAGNLRALAGVMPSESLEFVVANRGLIGLYYDYEALLNTIPDNSAQTPVMRRIDKRLQFESNVDFQLPMPAERFAVEWFGQVRVPSDGVYVFSMQSDDGARVTIGDQVAVEYPRLRAPGVTTGEIELSPGWHDIHIEFYENNGVENFVLRVKRPDEEAATHIETRDLRPERLRGIPNKWPVGQTPR